MPRKKIDKLTAFVKDYGAKGLAYAASQEDVDAAAEALIRAYSELKREAQTDYSGLDFEIEYAKRMLEPEGEYYESDMDAVREVLAEAEALREEAAGQDEVDQMVKAMRELRLSIRKRPQFTVRTRLISQWEMGLFLNCA